MNREQARTVAEALGGEAWHSGGNIWLVRFNAADGRLVAVSEEMVCEYADEAAFGDGRAAKVIELPVPAPVT